MKDLKIIRRNRALALAGVAIIAAPLAFGLISNAQSSGMGAAVPVAMNTGAVQGYAPIVAVAKPAVVTIVTERRADAPAAGPQGMPEGMPEGFNDFFRKFFGERGMPERNAPGQAMPMPKRGPVGGIGSGFIVAADGTIVTNNHVIDDAETIKVVLDDGAEFEAKVLGRDSKTDLAVIKIEAGKDLPHLAWGESDHLQAGDPILAIGNPFGIGTTVTAGIVSARGRDLRNGPYDDFIQVDAPINHGNSGGPLLDTEGNVVGVNTAIYSPNGGNVGVGFAIPSDQASDIVARLIAEGDIEHGYIGVSIQPVTKDVADALGLEEARGALVGKVSEASPAAAAGLEAGDIVTAFGETKITDPRSLSRAVADLKPGTKSTVTVLRKGETRELAVVVGSPEGEMAALPVPQGEEKKDGVAVSGLGVTLADPSKADREAAGMGEDQGGALVTSVTGDAEESLRSGDIILSVNQVPVKSAMDAGKRIDAARKDGKRSVLLLVERGEQQSFVAVPFERS